MVQYVQNGTVHTIDDIASLVDLISTGTVLPHDKIGVELVSKYKERLPLYDIESDRIYLIHWMNVFDRIFYDGYRMIDSDLAQLITPSQEHNYNILQWYDLKLLRQTFFRIFYNSFATSSYITNCVKPSYDQNLPHIKPYYKSSELNYFGLDWGLIDKITLDPKELASLCKEVRSKDVDSQTLMAHQLYIYKNRAIGLVKHYSLYGSYFMNVYLRKDLHTWRDAYLENQINIMTKAISKAPAFDKDHVLYRFVRQDHYLAHLKIGDRYRDNSFMSTTRNPFYSQGGDFGQILLRILIPGKIKGIGLCIESYSNFPSEEEIILSPGSEYELISIDEPTVWYKTFKLTVQRRYTLKWLGITGQRVIDAPFPLTSKIDLQDIVKEDPVKYLNISERVGYLRSIANPLNQFVCTINDHDYTFVLDSYRSNTVYEPYFFYTTADGLMITTTNPAYGNINMMIEIGQALSVNYYFRYSVTDPSRVIDLDTQWWMQWLSMLAYVLGVRNVIIHSNYILKYDPNDSINKQIAKTRYTFSQNIYEYMTQGKRMYDYLEVTPNFDYKQLDILKVTRVTEHIHKSDRTELYRIYQESGEPYLHGFYIYVVDNYPRFIKLLEQKIASVYDSTNNPFTHVSYTLDAWVYLMNRRIITSIPSAKDSVSKGSFKKLIGDNKIPLFKNRLRAAQQLT